MINKPNCRVRISTQRTGNRLTLYILAALLLGIGCGIVFNGHYVNKENARIAAYADSIRITKKMMKMSCNTMQAYKPIADKQIAQYAVQQKAATAILNKKLEPFSLMGDLFLRLIKMIIAPLVFSTLAVGVAKLGDIKSVGRIGAKTLLWFLVASVTSLLLGMALVNIFKPGEAMHLAVPDVSGDGISNAGFTVKDFLYHVFPVSITDAMARNEILQIVVFAILFGTATAAIGEKGQIITKLLDAVSHVILKMTGYIMLLAPIAVFGAICDVVARQGAGVIQTYSIFIGEFYLGLLILWAVLLLAGSFFIRKRVFMLLGHIKAPLLLAFSTSSSEAAFPKTMLELERFGCPEKIVSFVLPLGYSFNLDGGMMYMTFASIFIAQSYSIHLDLGTQLSMMLVLMLMGKGIAGVPRASLVVIAGALTTFKLPEAGLALLLGIDPILDMGRSATNVLGNSIATAVISKAEGKREKA